MSHKTNSDFQIPLSLQPNLIFHSDFSIQQNEFETSGLRIGLQRFRDLNIRFGANTWDYIRTIQGFWYWIKPGL